MKQTKQITIATCDRCKREGDTGDMEGRNEWGETYLTYKGHTGCRAYDGAAGGCNHESKAWLCLTCTRALFDFLQNKPVSTQP